MVAGLVALPSIAGCGSSESAGPPELVWFINPDAGNGAPDKPGQGKIAKQCSDASGGKYTIRTQLLPNSASDQRQQLLRRLAAGDTGVDIMSVDPVFTSEFAEAGYLAPLPEDLQKDALEDRVDGAVEASKWKGKVVSVPMWSNTQLLWYRKSSAQKAGLDPEKGVTWDQLVKAAKSENKSISVQARMYEGYTVWINALVEGAGGHILENPGSGPDDVRLGLDSDAGKAAAKVVHDIAAQGVGGPALSSTNETTSLTMFQNGDSTYMVNWPYVYAALSDPAKGVPWKDDIGFAVYPRTVEGKDAAPPYGGIQLSVNSKSEHVAEAYEAVKCITSAEHQKEYMLGTGNPASRKSVYDDAEVKKAMPMAPLIRESLDQSAPRPMTQFYGDLTVALQQKFSPPDSVGEGTPAAAQEFVLKVLKGEALL